MSVKKIHILCKYTWNIHCNKTCDDWTGIINIKRMKSYGLYSLTMRKLN